MKRIVLCGVAVAALLIGLVGPANAGPPPPDFDYNPTSGPAGTVITAGGDCRDFVVIQWDGGASGEPAAPLGFSGVTATLELADQGSVLDSTTVATDNDGLWSAQVTVPAGTPAGEYHLNASCAFPVLELGAPRSDAGPASPHGQFDVYNYATQLFTVTAQATTTTTAGPTSTTGATSTTGPSVAAQAQRVQPSFTG